MKTIGLIGGMSWQSSAVYYRHINELVNQQLGGVHSATIQMHSVDYSDFIELGNQGNWDEVGRSVAGIAKNLENAGAAFVLICCNTVHKIADAVQDHINVPLLHIADSTGEAIVAQGLKKVALIGTSTTMNGDFIKGRLLARFGVECIVPGEEDKAYLDHVIYTEFCLGQFKAETKKEILAIISRLQQSGAQGVILGCTELPMIIDSGDCQVPSFDTTFLHAATAVKTALVNQ